ncbi:MAG: PorT family protein [Bacteroidales bacterium]|nr:PorT family protein [Bacteroidales bacterium]
MKNLSKLLTIAFIICMTSASFAQTFGVKAGFNASNFLAMDKDDTYSDDFKMNPGFHIAATAEYPLTDMFSFETGMGLSTKGYRIDESETILGHTLTVKGGTNLLYVDIPLTAKATFDLGKAKVYGVFGPYLGFGIIGKMKYELSVMGESETEETEIKWGSDEAKDDIKRFDYGLIIGAGVDINAIQFGLSYGLGLANISAYTDNHSLINNRVLGLSIGYKFGVR